MNKKLIRLTESDLTAVIKEAVGKIIREYTSDELRHKYGSPTMTDDEEEEIFGKRRPNKRKRK